MSLSDLLVNGSSCRFPLYMLLCYAVYSLLEHAVSNVIPFISIQQAERLCFVLNNVKANKVITKALSVNFAYLCTDTFHMHMFHFYKYQGAGNDFIVIDNRDSSFNIHETNTLARLCDRRFGVGADGIMLLNRSGDLDFEMVYYNADGREGSMCGNGGRCIVAFAKKLGIIDSNTVFLAADGVHHARINPEGNWVTLRMGDVEQISRDGEAYVLNTGSPHYVKSTVNLASLDVYAEGKNIRYSVPYREEGINVNFAEDEPDGYFVRTYERGVENETLACGTGATAVALAMAQEKGLQGSHSIPIRVAGGRLRIHFTRDGKRFSDIFLEGPAEFVFEGQISI
jgi:diaminopimelate epimerase